MVGRLDQIVQDPMMVIFECYKPEGLRNHIRTAADRLQHFSHSLNVAGPGLKGNLNEVALCKCFWDLQQPSRSRDGLKPCFCPLAVAQSNLGLCSCELNSSGAMQSVNLGIVCHAATTISSVG